MKPSLARYQLLVAAVIAAFVLTGTAAAAKPAPLYSSAGGWSCTYGAGDTTGSFGSATISIDGTGSSALVTVRLRNAAPNTTYDLFVSQTVGSGCHIPLPFAALTTNDRGAGSARGTVTVDPAASRRQVLVETGGVPSFATALAS